MVFLQVSRDVLDRRLLARRGHFFPEKLLDSQLAALEPPTPDEERVVTVLAEGGADRREDHRTRSVPTGRRARRAVTAPMAARAAT